MQRGSVVLPHRAEPLECERVLAIQLQDVHVCELGFVIIACFEIIVSLTQEARFSGFLGTGGNEENGQNKRYDFE